MALEHGEQLDLQVQRHLPHFVEEDGAAIGSFEVALSILIGAGERPQHVPEELGLEELFRECRAVHVDERPFLARALHVYGTCEILLANTGRARDQQRSVHSNGACQKQHCARLGGVHQTGGGPELRVANQV